MKNRKLMAAAAVVSAVNIAVPAVAAPYLQSGQTAEVQAENAGEESREFGNVWETDTRISTEGEADLIKDAEMTLDKWDAEIAAAKAEGFGNPLDAEALKKAGADIREDGKAIYYIGGNSLMGPVADTKDAYRLAYSLLPMFGGTEQTDLRIWAKLTMNDQTVYSFQQVADGTAMTGSTLKIAVDQDGTVSAVFNGIEKEDAEEAAGNHNVTREEAEEAVRAHLKEEPGQKADILSDKTGRILRMPVTMEMLKLEEQESGDEEDVIPVEVLWVVYTPNDDAEYPFLAHYVRLDGTYDSSLPVKEPGDGDARCGFRKEQLFEGMTADTWSGEITDHNDVKRTVTLPVMYNQEKKCWYLGDQSRKIAVADYKEAAYGENHALKLVSSDKNEWDNEDLYMLYNYIRAWDYYADMGWIGPDGKGTEVVILKDLCSEDGTPFENACSIGMVQGWQMFGYTAYCADGTPLRLTHGLDVMAHEYTHTFTTAMMSENLYENDYGAINEAMSDIMGNIVEYTLQDTEDTQWTLGENTGMTIRSMSDPHAYQQPEYVWDVFYGPHTDYPKVINDEGGVHGNSSLMNKIAARLCMDYNMSLQEASDFWIMTEMGLTPRTDFVRLGALLDWALHASGNEAYADGLKALADSARLDVTEIPDSLPHGQKLVKLRLPDNEVFANHDWALIALQVDVRKIGNLGGAAIELVKEMFKNSEEMKGVVKVLRELADKLKLEDAKLKLDSLDLGDDDAVTDVMAEIFTDSLSGIIVQSMSWEQAGDGEIAMVTSKDPAVYALLSVDESGTKVNGAAVLLGSHWYDLGGLIKTVEDMAELTDENGEPDEEQMTKGFEELFTEIAEGIAEPKESSETKNAEDAVANGLEMALDVAEILLDEAGILPEDAGLEVPAEPNYLPMEGLETVQFMEMKSTGADTDSGAEAVVDSGAEEVPADSAAEEVPADSAA